MIATYTVLATILSSIGVTDIRVYVILFALATALIHVYYYPLKRRTSYVMTGVSLMWIIWAGIYMIQLLGL
ncbi:hypothetical protein HS7_15240 [Sulfolobales archaeon HS-7]|nr:hypothetical protein HS7_15240 [Sulfolobales archaeon HS-7]